MIRTLFRTSIRALFKDRIFTMTGFIGLVIANTLFLTIASWIYYNLTFDRFFSDHRNIVRIVTSEFVEKNLIGNYANTYEGISAELPLVFPEISASTKFYTCSDDDVQVSFLLNANPAMVSFSNFRGIVTDSSFFRVFPFQFVYGSTANFSRNGIVLSESFARRFFGPSAASAIGTRLKLFDGDSFDYNVVGIIQDMPDRSHMRFDLIIADQRPPGDFWTGPLYYTYFQVREGTSLESLEAKINKWLSDKSSESERKAKLSMQRLSDIHLSSQLEDELSPNADWKMLLGLGTFAFLILAIAWCNFTNLSVARILERGKEVYLHQLFGAGLRTLILRYALDSMVLNTLAVILASLFLTLGKGHLQLYLKMNYSQATLILLSFIGLMVIAGIVISVVVSAIIVKHQVSRRAGQSTKPYLIGWFQRSLIIVQYGITLILLTVTAGVFAQMKYVSNFGLGFDKTNIVVIKSFDWTQESWSDSSKSFLISDAYKQKSGAFMEELKKYGFVGSLTSISHIPGEDPQWGSEFTVEGGRDDNVQPIRCIGVGYDFVRTLNLKLLAGRDFSQASATDKGSENDGAILVNSAVVRSLNLGSAQEALHKFIRTEWGARYEIIGVIDSYHQVSLKHELTPLYYRLEPRALRYYLVKLNTSAARGNVDQLKVTWDKFFSTPFDYFFFEDFLSKVYADDAIVENTISVFSLAAILISALGLFAFTTYLNAKRKKEMAIRKVLGASSWQILNVILRSFGGFICVAVVFAMPVSAFILVDWQTQFVFKENLSLLLFLAPILLIVIITLLSVTYHSWKASSASPIESIRNN